MEIVGFIILAVPALLYFMWLCIPAAFTIYEQLSWWFDIAAYNAQDNISVRPIQSILTWLFGFPGTILGIFIWLLVKVPKFIFKAIFG